MCAELPTCCPDVQYDRGDMLVSSHWATKKLEEMTERDWRIFREDFNIAYRGSNPPLPYRTWDECPLPKALRKAVDKVRRALALWQGAHAAICRADCAPRISAALGWLQEAISHPDGSHSHRPAAARCHRACRDWKWKDLRICAADADLYHEAAADDGGNRGDGVLVPMLFMESPPGVDRLPALTASAAVRCLSRRRARTR